MYYTAKNVFDRLWAGAVATTKTNRLSHYALLGLAGWLLATVLLHLVDEEAGELTLYLSLLWLHALLLHGFNFYAMLPRLQRQGKEVWSYVWRLVLVVLLFGIAFGLLCLALTQNPEDSAGFGLFNGVFQLVVTGPVSWVLYKRHAQRLKQIEGLETELGQTAAKLDFLRSQINPHFLFNSLNTLYGMALQENSEKTAQGVQMLGDMMRFMLHENHQPRIGLAREVEYLQNYIALQQLRTAASPGISISTNLPEVVSGQQIAPMLLIPFVENAFKHGISLQHKSWISISLECRHDTLYFDVHNSVHAKSGHEAEIEASGVGLENVRQRLALLYPGRHELIARQTANEYFVHLTLQLQNAPADGRFEDAH